MERSASGHHFSTTLVLLTAAAVTVIAACHRSPQPEARRPVRFVFQNRVGSAIPIMAVAKDLFTAQGIAVQASRFSSGPACSEALFTGAADIGTMGDTTAIIALSRTDALRLVASHATGEHRHRLIVAESSPYQTIQHLTGKRIGIKKGTSTYGGFLKFLATNGMALAAIQVIDLSPAMMPEALAAGSIDAFAASEPTPSLGELHGGRELATFGGLGNSYPIMLVARERFIRERPDDLQQFLAAFREAEELIDSDRVSAIAEVARATGLPCGVAGKAMQRHSYRLRADDEILRSLQDTAQFLLDQRQITSVPDLRFCGHLGD